MLIEFNSSRYGIQLIKGIQELHSLGLLVLNLKPSNFLLNENGQAVLGDFGLPYLLLGIPLADPDFASRLGTPSYMAPEQWEPEVRGPIAHETDSWGFGCSIVEMLTGIRPWFGRSIKEIYESVVIRGEKPQIPGGLPPAVQNILYSCFEYDFRHRPLMTDILQVFERFFFFIIFFLILLCSFTLCNATFGIQLLRKFLSKKFCDSIRVVGIDSC